MLAELDIASHAVGLKMNTKKTKAMRNCFAISTPITIGATQLEDVDEYVYLGRLINSQNKLKPELARRKRAGWAAFSSIRTVIDSTKDVKLRAQLFDSTVLPALCYGAETWSLTKSLANQLRVAHASFKRRLVGLNLRQQTDVWREGPSAARDEDEAPLGRPRSQKMRRQMEHCHSWVVPERQEASPWPSPHLVGRLTRH
uniref:Endonuclease-reverse transcriptase n=1 Tax=Plectus sambesii TaxID=2011161 RepID=A0A914X1G5_9BILA